MIQHVCTCGGCSPVPYEDRCQFEGLVSEGIAVFEKYLPLLEGKVLGATVVGQHGLSTRDMAFWLDKAKKSTKAVSEE